MKRLISFLLCAIAMLAVGAKTGQELIRENGFKQSVNPLLKTQWSQTGAFNSKLPILDGQQTVTGCGATALAQVMKFYNYPEYGQGNHYHLWEQGATPEVFYADFEHTHYDWANMLDVYNSSASGKQVDAVATLMLHIGIALEMKFNTSTATQIEYIHTVLKKYFGYNPNMCLLRQKNGAYTIDEWRTIIYRELSEGRPVLMGGTSYSGVRHIFVADGYDAEGNVHLNLGHANRNNEDKYYDLTHTNETYTNDMRMIIGILPSTLPADITTITLDGSKSLMEAIGGETESTKVCMLKVVGQMSADDVSCLGKLSRTTTGQLSYIDLSEATFPNNEIPESAFNSGDEGNLTLQQIILPDGLEAIKSKAFRNALGLHLINFPETLVEIGQFAFSACRYLSEVALPSSLRKYGDNPFRMCQIEDFKFNNKSDTYDILNGALCNTKTGALLSMPLNVHNGKYVIPNGIIGIGRQAFYKNLSIKEITFPSTLKSIGAYAFLQCYALENVYSLSAEPPTIDVSTSFYQIPTNCVLHVPVGCKEAYNSWTMFSQIVDDIKTGVMPGDVTGDGIVDVSDMNAVVNAMLRGWMTTDINADGTVDVSDLNIVVNTMLLN
mgnify:CR=1 FL=1